MPGPLTGRKVAITEHRFESEFRALIERHGATVVSCPLLEERPVDNHDELRTFIHHLIDGGLDHMVFFTGVGVRFLAEAARAGGVFEPFVEALDRVEIVARGPKPRAALRELGRTVDHAPQQPTSDGLLDLYRTLEPAGKRIGVQLYGKPNPEFVGGLESLGAQVATVQVYDYRPASDRDRVLRFIQSLIADDIDVMTITSGPQVGSLFDVADEAGLSAPLVERLNGPVAVAVIGEVAERALAHRGIRGRIHPRAPKMAPLAQAIADHFSGALPS